MANFTKIASEETLLFKNADCYQITGAITMEDVAKINSSFEKSILMLPNTRGQNPNIIGYLNPEKVIFSVLGGYDYSKYQKYNDSKFIERTLYKPKQLAVLIREFERIERKMDPLWGEMEKTMYIYYYLGKSINYRRESDSGYGNGIDLCWSLNGLLYRNSTSAGYSLILKEMLDRNGVDCEMQSSLSDYSWNIARIDGKLYGIDLAKDSVNKRLFSNFGMENSDLFYGNSYRQIVDSETSKYPLHTFNEERIKQGFERIKPYKKETYMDVLKPIETVDGHRYLIANLGSIEGVSYYIQASPPSINYFYAQDSTNISRGLTRENLERLRESGNILGTANLKEGMPRFNKFKNKDGVSFIIFPESAKVKHGVKSYHIIDSTELNERPMLRRISISSENNLEMLVDPAAKKVVANVLLDPSRLDDRLINFGGYVGYVAPESISYFGERTLEKEKVKVVA